jgi:uncharacterized protein (AIM24 family)
MTAFINQDNEKERCLLRLLIGKILPIDLTEFQGKFICQNSLCAAKVYLLELNSQKIGGFFGGEGFIMQKKRRRTGICTLEEPWQKELEQAKS